MLEQRADHALEAARVLAEGRVFQLHDVDAVQQDLALDQPFDFRSLEFVDGMRGDGSEVRIAIVAAHHEFHRLAVSAQSLHWPRARLRNRA